MQEKMNKSVNFSKRNMWGCTNWYGIYLLRRQMVYKIVVGFCYTRVILAEARKM